MKSFSQCGFGRLKINTTNINYFSVFRRPDKVHRSIIKINLAKLRRPGARVKQLFTVARWKYGYPMFKSNFHEGNFIERPTKLKL